jgi:hypothetical protein
MIKINNASSCTGKRIRVAVAALLGKSPHFKRIVFECCGNATEMSLAETLHAESSTRLRCKQRPQ